MVIAVWLFKQVILGVQNVKLYLKEKAACLFCQSGKKNELGACCYIGLFCNLFWFCVIFCDILYK